LKNLVKCDTYGGDVWKSRAPSQPGGDIGCVVGERMLHYPTYLLLVVDDQRGAIVHSIMIA